MMSISISRRSGLVVVALASILIGLLVGSSVALAHTGDTIKQTGHNTYTARHTDCLGYDCDYLHIHIADEYSNWEGFNILNTRYVDYGDNDGLVFGLMYIWDEYGENTREVNDFYCEEIDDFDETVNTWWGHGGHDSPNYGTAVTQYIWYSSSTCAYPDGAGAHEMTLYVD